LFEAWPPDSVTCNGQVLAFNADPSAAAGWHYEGDSLTTIIRLPRMVRSAAVELTVRVSPDKAARLALLDGAVGRLARIRRLFKEVNNSGPESLLHLATTGRRVELKPETALPELAAYDAARASMEGELNRTSDNAWSLLWSLQVSAASNKVEDDR